MSLVECPLNRLLLLRTKSHPAMRVKRIESEVLELVELTQMEQPCVHSLLHICMSASANLEASKIWMIDGEICT